MLHGGISGSGGGVARSGVCLYILGSEILTDSWKIHDFSSLSLFAIEHLSWQSLSTLQFQVRGGLCNMYID